MGDYIQNLGNYMRSLLGESTIEIKPGQPIQEVGRKPSIFESFGNKLMSLVDNTGKTPNNVISDYSPSPVPTQNPQKIDVQSQYVQPTPSSMPSTSPVLSSMARNPNVSKYSISDDVKRAIELAAAKYGIPASLLYDIALQESSFNPTLKNPLPGSTATGLFQFTQPTWDTAQNYANMPNSSLSLPQGANRLDPQTNALVAAYLIKNGQLGRWDASKGVWGEYYQPEELNPYYSQTLGYNQ